MPFSPKANFVHGHPIMVDYTNSGTSQVNAGDVLVINNSLRIAHRDIAPGSLGALAAGGGIYDVVNAANTNGAAVSDGNLVRWDATNQTCSTGTNNAKLGACIGGGNTNNATLRVEHGALMNL